ncbi:hypothetical protein LTR37_018370 [Vermiconidia calcicola]|uniref:Uncharacterized protein n=1 Tax=Vermiconidia calcicola TaxID=1690605 RepID=A0ACC3MH26_9PEZI|nr:hypothetical protein LTR37_018370 [Vermiconidia calcicola]
MPEISHNDSPSVHSLDSNFGNSFPSYADQELAHERAQESRDKGKREADEIAIEAQQFTQQADDELARLEDEAGQKYDDWSAEAKGSYEGWKKDAGRKAEKVKKETSKRAEQVKKEASKDAQKAKENAKKTEKWADENKGNPVVIGNAVVVTALAALLGTGAYRMHQANELTWKVAGAWAGVVGLFAVGDYYVSQYVGISLSMDVTLTFARYFFKKYPPKQ